MRYIISIIILLSAATTFAQEADSVTVELDEPDTIKVSYLPTGVRVGVDAMALGYTIFNENISSQLFIADIDFHKYFLVAEFGRYERTRVGTNGTNYVNGSYWRIGADINMFKVSPDNSVLFFGFRYGKSSFSDELTANINDPYYGTQPINEANNNLSADWYELVAGLKIPVWKLWFGYNLRMKFGVDSFGGLKLRPYEVPGYGIAAEKDYWEFNYYVMYRIEWGEE